MELYKTRVEEKIQVDDKIKSLYLVYPSYAFRGKQQIEYEIIDKISREFGVPIQHIDFIGSAKIGYSLVKEKEFSSVTSDLDISIIDSQLFARYMEIVIERTKNFSDLSKFLSLKGEPSYRQYSKCISKGIFRPDLMVNCQERSKWFSFFRKLSNKYYKEFKNINAGIYISENAFIMKQREALNKF